MYYYLQDHLGFSRVMTDDHGNIVQESTGGAYIARLAIWAVAGDSTDEPMVPAALA